MGWGIRVYVCEVEEGGKLIGVGEWWSWPWLSWPRFTA